MISSTIASIPILYSGALHLKNFNDQFFLSILRHAVAVFHPGLIDSITNIIKFFGMIEFGNCKPEYCFTVKWIFETVRCLCSEKKV